MGLFKNLFSPKNWSEWVFGGGLPVQAYKKTAAERRAVNKTADTVAQVATAKINEEQDAMKGEAAQIEELRRRKGFLASIIAGKTPNYGLGALPKRKTLLGG